MIQAPTFNISKIELNIRLGWKGLPGTNTQPHWPIRKLSGVYPMAKIVLS
jgi:hypothetical protein